MEALRRIVNLDNLRNMIDIPPTFNHKKVEVLILPVENDELESEKKFNPLDFYGVSQIDNIDREIEKIREEWN